MVRLIVSTQQGGLDDQVSQVFGRCQTYTIVDVENGDIKNVDVVQNQYANAMSGAGIQAAGFVANQGAEAVISGNYGPNVVSVLKQSGVKMISASGMSVREAVQKYLNGNLESVSQPTSAAKSGMGGGGGRGMGMGMGRGMRSQQPSQQPIQQGQQSAGTSGQQPSQPSSEGNKEVRIDKLENRLEKLEGQLDEIMKGLEDLKQNDTQ